MKNKKKIIAPKVNSGFTLLELILASLITTIVVTVTGIGLLNLSSSDIRNAAEKELITNFNRASSFISDELRQARRVLPETDSNPASTEDLARVTIPNNASDPLPDNVTKVLGIVNPNFSTRIIYFTGAPRAKDRLIGPRVLYRYGPDLNANGTYNTASVGISAVTDLIPNANDSAVLSSLRRTCPCGWTRIPDSNTNIDGFSVCVNSPSNNPPSPCPSPAPSPSPDNLTRVNFRLYGTVPLTITGTPRISYEASTNVFTRSAPPSPSP